MKVHSVFCDHSNNNLENWRSEMVVAKRGTWRFWILGVLRRLGSAGLLCTGMGLQRSSWAVGPPMLFTAPGTECKKGLFA
jgi:hypothetical protein